MLFDVAGGSAEQVIAQQLPVLHHLEADVFARLCHFERVLRGSCAPNALAARPACSSGIARTTMLSRTIPKLRYSFLRMLIGLPPVPG